MFFLRSAVLVTLGFLHDFSVQMELEGHINITFLGNSATVHGGGVFVSHSPLTADLTDYQLIYQRCFVRHDRVSVNLEVITVVLNSW